MRERARGLVYAVAVSGALEQDLPARRSLLGGAKAWELVVLGAVPLAFFFGFVSARHFGFDLRQFWQGGRDVLHGVSPYPTARALANAGSDLDPRGIQHVFRFPYPAGSAVAFVPLALLPFKAAAVVMAVISVAALLGALWLLGVRDWRCYGILLAAIPVITAVHLGTLTPLLVLALALTWRYRDRTWIAGAALAAAIVLKVFLWPLVIWLAATRRFAAAAVAAGLAVSVTLVAWAGIGFAGFSQYPHLVRRLTDVVSRRGFSVAAFAQDLGLGGSSSRLLVWLVGGAVLALAVAAAGGTDGDRRSFALAVLASILLTPIVWLHYFALLFVPVAVWRRRLALPWFLPLLFWLTPFQETRGDAWRVAVGLASAALVLVAAGARIPAAEVG
jgi:hypothetical protein